MKIVRHRSPILCLPIGEASRLVLPVSILVLVGLAGTRTVEAQTERALQWEQSDPVPYITHAEFQDICVGGETVSSKSSSSPTTFSEILSVGSLDEVTRRFGEPTSIEYNRFPEESSTDYTVYLTYDGSEFKYRKRGEKIRLETMAIASEDRFLKFGGVKLQPGMNTEALSTAIREAIESDGDGVIGVKVAWPGKSKDVRSIQDSHTEIQIWTEENQKGRTVKEVRFHRIAP